MTIQALLFDKDGTLFDFDKTWNAWTLGVIEHYAGEDKTLAAHIAQTIQFDLSACQYLPSSPVIAGTNREAAELFASALVDPDTDAVEQYLAESAIKAPVTPAVPLRPLLSEFRSGGVKLGVVTNDTERGAHAHLDAANVGEMFDFVIGHDSGFGAKPDPDPLLGFARQVQVDPEFIAMVGDSRHDLIAGRRAGMRTVGVLTGVAETAELANLADVVLPDIGHLPQWLKAT